MFIQKLTGFCPYDVLYLVDDLLVACGCHAFQLFEVNIRVSKEPLFVCYLEKFVYELLAPFLWCETSASTG